MNYEEEEYLFLLQKILQKGNKKEDRTGTGTLSIFGSTLRFDLSGGKIPLLTTKKVFVRGVIEELLFFIRGETDTKKLEEKGINIWKGNTSREFLDSRGLEFLPEGSLGKSYGFQWRSFGEEWDLDRPGIKATPQQSSVISVDQLEEVFQSIKKDPNGRRHIVSAWNPMQLREMALPPCHMMFQFYVNDGKLSCLWHQRSVDAFLGLPFNIASYAILTHMMAKATGLEPGELIFNGGDTHLYLNHTEQVKEQLTRTPKDFPHINIKKNLSSVEDMEKLCFEDFEILGYDPLPAIKAPMAV